nr:AAA family ATPase [Defluviimonas salinarum]
MRPEAEAWLEEARRAHERDHPGRPFPSGIADCPFLPYDLTDAQAARLGSAARRVWSWLPPETRLHGKIDADEKAALAALSKSARAVHLTEAEIDVAFAGIHAQAPWLARLTETAWTEARRRACRGLPAGFGPLLVLGPPGIGKTRWARAAAAALGVPFGEVDAGATGGVFGVQGTETGWGTANPGALVRLMLDRRIANPVFLVDELDAGDGRTDTTKGSLPGLHRVLLGLVEPMTARAWRCPYFQLPFDMASVSWVMTSNTAGQIHQPLLDRLTVVELPDLSAAQLAGFARGEATARLGAEIAEIIAAEILRRARSGQRQSLRHVTRMIERAEAVLDQPILQ